MPAFVGSWRKQGDSITASTSASLAKLKHFECVDHSKLWKILKEMGILSHLTCLLRNLFEGQEATVRTRHGTMDWFKTGKGVRQDWTLSRYLFNLYEEHIMWNTRLDESQAGINCQEKCQQPQIHRWYDFNGRKWRGIKEPLVEGERGDWKNCLKTQHSKKLTSCIQPHHFMVNRWKQWELLFSWAPESLQMVTVAMTLKDACS